MNKCGPSEKFNKVVQDRGTSRFARKIETAISTKFKISQGCRGLRSTFGYPYAKDNQEALYLWVCEKLADGFQATSMDVWFDECEKLVARYSN